MKRNETSTIFRSSRHVSLQRWLLLCDVQGKQTKQRKLRSPSKLEHSKWLKSIEQTLGLPNPQQNDKAERKSNREDPWNHPKDLRYKEHIALGSTRMIPISLTAVATDEVKINLHFP